MQRLMYESCITASLLIVLTRTRQRINNSENIISPHCIVLSVAANKSNYSIVYDNRADARRSVAKSLVILDRTVTFYWLQIILLVIYLLAMRIFLNDEIAVILSSINPHPTLVATFKQKVVINPFL